MMTTRRFTPRPIPAVVLDFTTTIAIAKPATPQAITKLGFTLRKLASGKFRNCFEVVGHQCIVKVPKRYTYKHGHPAWKNPIRHAQIEMETLRMIIVCSHHEHLRRYVPQIYYGCLETGLVVMPLYSAPPQLGEGRRGEMHVIGQMFRDTLKKWTADYVEKNIMQDDNGGLVVVDLGY